MKKLLTLTLLASASLLSQPLKAVETASITTIDANKKYKLEFVTSWSTQTARLTKIDLLNYDADIVIPETVKDEYGDSYTVTIIGAKQDAKSADPDMFDTAGTANSDCALFRDADPDYAQYIVGLTLPSSITTIWPNAFRESKIKKIEIPSGVTEIGAAAFIGSELTEITLPNSITNVYPYTFYGCANLSNISMGSNILEIRDSAFNNISTNVSISIDTKEPPKVSTYSFTNGYYATVKVPYGTSEAYAEKWTFSNMTFIEMKDGETSAVSTPTAKYFEIDCNNGLVSASNDSPIDIFSITGAKIYSGNGKNIKLANGFYIIRCKDESVKVYVK